MPKKHNKKQSTNIQRELLLKSDGMEYATVIQVLGNGRMRLRCFDGKERLGILRGAMHKRVWVSVGDLVLAGLREFEDGKCDIVHKYTPEEARTIGPSDEEKAVEEDDIVFDIDGI